MENSIIRIAIADDHDIVRTGFIHLIHTSDQYKVVVEAADGKELVDKVASLKTPPDVCILDIGMPILNGYEAIVLLKARIPEMKILALTQFHEEYSIIRMIKNGANGYLLKTCKMPELLEAIMAVHTYGYYYSRTASEKAFAVVKNNYLPGLTAKEIEFLRLCCTDLGYTELAEIMSISVYTIQEYQKNVSRKLHIHSRTSLALFAIHTGLVPL